MLRTSLKNSILLLVILLTVLISGCVPEKTTAPALTPLTLTQVVPTILPQETAIPTGQDMGVSECLSGHKAESAKVTRVIDGDTIEIKLNGRVERVRYLMVDAPEMTASDPGPGRQASKYNQQMVDGKTISMVKDTTDRDGFGRLLRFVSVDGVSVNYELVKKGYATTFNRPPDDLCSFELQKAMLEAFQERLGIWRSIPVTANPSGNVCPEGCKQPVRGCDIKGNINSQGDRIYHLPGSHDYPSVEISSKYGELWFCTIDEAIANGWRPPRVE